MSAPTPAMAASSARSLGFGAQQCGVVVPVRRGGRGVEVAQGFGEVAQLVDRHGANSTIPGTG